MAEIIGYFQQNVIDLLELNDISCGTPIFLGESNIEHMKNRHPYEFDKYFPDIREIINNPDYVGQNPKDLSISFVKEYLISSNMSGWLYVLLLLESVLQNHYMR